MNQHLIESYIRDRLGNMTDLELDAVEQDCIHVIDNAMSKTVGHEGRPFVELVAEDLANTLRLEPSVLPQVKYCAYAFPGLALHLIPHFPELSWLKEAAAGQPRPRQQTLSDDCFLENAIEARDEVERRWLAIRDEIAAENFFEEGQGWELDKLLDNAALPNSPGKRIEELVAYAELSAGAHCLGDVHKPVTAHLREQKIDRLTQFISHFADPTAGTADVLAVEEGRI